MDSDSTPAEAQILILHLSDLHIKESDGKLRQKFGAIAKAVQPFANLAEACFVVLAGDIASSGTQVQYEAALECLTHLLQELSRSFKRTECIMVPGNHDCSFQDESQTRQMLIEQITEDSILQLRESTINDLASVQGDFFTFARLVAPGSFPEGCCLYCELRFTVADYSVRFNCYNTSLTSQLKEKPGQVVYPVESCEESSQADDLVCAVFHHPYNWFSPESGKMLRRRVEKTADVILTGHEHDPDRYTKVRAKGDVSEYVEGAALQEPDSANSAFNVMLFDLHLRQHRTCQYSWNGAMYVPIEESGWQVFHRSRRVPFLIENNKDYMEYLYDPGVGFIHPRKEPLVLSDIFVFPDLKEVRLGSGAREMLYETIKEENVIDYLLDHGKVLLLGPSMSGKTSLLKVLYIRMLDRGLTPILLHGPSITSAKRENIDRLIKNSFVEQYAEDRWEEYRQLDSSSKILLIDDLDTSRLNKKGKSVFLDVVQGGFGCTVITGTDFVELEKFTAEIESPLFSFAHCIISEFGYYLRSKLIEKWIIIGQEYSLNEDSQTYQTKTYENTINNLMKTRLLPSYPFVVLTILQNLESITQARSESGSYGYLYECLLTAAMSKTSQHIEDVDVKYGYLSQLAYYMFTSQTKAVEEGQLLEVTQDYCHEYDLILDYEDTVRGLVDANILVRREDCVSFKYPYIQYYFAARYMSQNLRSRDKGTVVQSQIETMAKNVYREEYANILIFLCYLSKDPVLLDSVLENAKSVFRGFPPADIDNDVIFVDQLLSHQLRISIPTEDIERLREERLKRLDEVQQTLNEADVTYDTEDADDIDNLDLALRLSLAITTVNILGQIVRNFPGTLPKYEKRSFTEECYMLGLRTLKALYQLMENNMTELKNELGHEYRRQGFSGDDFELTKAVDGFLFFSVLRATLGMIKRISYAVGSERLAETYKGVLQDHDTIGVWLIDTCVRLDHFKRVPKEQILHLAGRTEKKLMSFSVLKLLVVNNLTLYPWPVRTRQAVLTRLGIPTDSPALIEGPSRKVSRQ